MCLNSIFYFVVLQQHYMDERVKDARLREFKMGWTNLAGTPRQRRQDFKEVEQYALVPMSTQKK